MRKKLVLEDGSEFWGESIGSSRECGGEVVFNTGMAGYQEILTDPSYCGQIITLTYPLVGNYGVNHDDLEAIKPAAAGLIVREAVSTPSNWRSEGTLASFLERMDIPGLQGVDTRRLTRKIREYGTLRGRICAPEVDTEAVAAQLQIEQLPSNQVRQVSTAKMYNCPGRGPRIALVDFGVKRGILRELVRRDCDIYVFPFDTSFEEIMAVRPDGILLSNGPGDPRSVQDQVGYISEAVGILPILGICLGHQLLALSCGAQTSKLKFGHRGANHPVRDLSNGRVFITSQNHSYAVEAESLPMEDLAVTHLSLNDGTVEGIIHRHAAAWGIQYHPEASPGPNDSQYIFDQFLEAVGDKKKEGELYA